MTVGTIRRFPIGWHRSKALRFYSALLSLIALSMLMVVCDSVTSAPVTSDPVTLDSVLDSCGGSEFSGPSLYSGI